MTKPKNELLETYKNSRIFAKSLQFPTNNEIVLTPQDIIRLKKVIETDEFISIPQGLTREERIQFILNSAKKTKTIICKFLY